MLVFAGVAESVNRSERVALRNTLLHPHFSDVYLEKLRSSIIATEQLS